MKKKGGSKNSRNWVYQVEVSNRARNSVEGLVVKYTVYRKLHDRYAKKKTKFNGMVTGEVKLGKLEAQRRTSIETSPMLVRKVKSVTARGDTKILQKANESMAGIVVEVFFKNTLVGSQAFGELPAGIKKPGKR